MRRITLHPDDNPPVSTSNILDGLNPSQQEAARAIDGPVMIIAGAGSGKTRTLTYRIAHLLAIGKARPWQILALTFTNKAAREMRGRILKLVGEEAAKGLWMGTFHSIFARILRRECETLGYTSDFSIYDSEDSERVIRGLMHQHHIDPKQFSPRSVRARISGAKNQMVSPGEYSRLVNTVADEKAALLYQPYQQVLRQSNAMDFDDLLINPIRLFEKDAEALARYQERWQYLHIDEYQDTNVAQYTITKMLAAKHKNICVVGDDAQSIYAFRGADIRNILDFQRDYAAATVVRLEQNYRSTQRILNLADSVIKHNKDQLEKTLWTDNPEGDFIQLFEAISEKDEAQKVERTVRDLHLRFGYPYGAFAVLYRTNAQSRSLEDALRRAGIPYQIVGGINFYSRREIKDALAYLRLLVNPSDDESLRRIINNPTRGIGSKTIEILRQYAQAHGYSLWQAIEHLEDVGLPNRARSAVEKFQFLIAKYAAKLETLPPDELAKALIQETGMLVKLREENTVESLARWENVQELLSAIAEYHTDNEDGTLSTFLQEVTLVTDADTAKDDESRVRLMTLHASKGLEFPVVYITGLEEGLFPLAAAAQDPKELEEERRLLYVGITRAEERLFLSHARSRFRYGQQQPCVPSRFLSEMDLTQLRTESGRNVQDRRPSRDAWKQGGFGNNAGRNPHYWRNKSTRREPKPQADEGRRVIYDEGEGGNIVPGVRVEHHQFGQGKVLSVEGRGDRARATVFFKDVGQKKLVLKFARLRRIG